MKIINVALMMISILSFSNGYGQSLPETDGPGKTDNLPERNFFVSSPYFSFINGLDGEKNNIDMYELHLGYHFTEYDSVAIKAATWKLYQPLGIPWGPKLMDGSQRYSGRIRENGIGVSYQRFLWKGLFTSAEIMPMKKIYLDETGKKTGDGFRLYTSYHIGYQINFFNNRVFIKPQVHCNYWPIDSGGPDEFRIKDEKWNNYFLFEPNIYIGINF
jgi:hypothetical protein